MKRMRSVAHYTTIKALAAMVLALVAVDLATVAGGGDVDWRQALARYGSAAAIMLARVLRGASR